MKTTAKIIAFLLLISILTACGQQANAPSDAQIQTAIAQTAQADATFQTAVDQAVEATVIAMPPTPTAKPTVDPYTLSEEELAALIDASAEEAVAASEQASQATAQATTDGAYTEDEIYETMYYVYDAEAAIAYAEDLLYLYYDLYGELAEETIQLLYAIEDDLDDLAVAMTEVEEILVQGAEVATAAIEQLDATMSNVQDKVSEARANSLLFKEQLPVTLQERENKFANLAPTEIASDREGALLQIFSYTDTVKAALEDRKVTPGELGNIAQLGANAQASIHASGAPLLQGFSGNIDGITRKLSRGDFPGAQRDFGGFEASLPSRPTRR